MSLAVTIPFIKEGLANNEKCIYLVDENTVQQIKTALEEAGVDVEGYLRSGQLVIAPAKDIYLSDGEFIPDRMISFIKDVIEEVESKGYRGFRGIAEMSWALTERINFERVIEYEAKINTFLLSLQTRIQVKILCQYDMERLTGREMAYVLYTHPKTILRSQVYDSPFYVDPMIILSQLEEHI